MVPVTPRFVWRSCASGLRTLLAVAALAAGSVTFAPAPGHGAESRLTFDINGRQRAMRFIEFSRLKKSPRMTIIVLHAGRGSVVRLRRSLGLDELARATGAALVYPVAIGGRWDIGKAGAPPTNDMLFVRAIVNRLVSERVSDRRRVYLAGVSSGGIVAMRLACENANLFAGVAAVTANLPADLAPACKPSRPLPFLLINGSADPMMPYGGGKAALGDYTETVASTDATLAPFAAAAGCGPQRTRIDLANRDKRDGSRAVIERLGGCKAQVELIRIEGGGHTIPGRRRPAERGTPVGAQNADIDTARVLMDFFRRNRR